MRMQQRLLEQFLIVYARRFPIRRGKLRIVEALWRLAVGENPFRLAALRYGEMTMPCNLTEALQRQFYFFGTYFLEEDILAIWSGMARNANVIFDVGANVGIYSLAALAAHPHAVVHAFEPTPEIAGCIRVTARMNGLAQLMVNEIAVTDQDGFVALHRYRGETGNNGGMNFTRVDASAPDTERVPAICLDSFCAQRGITQIDLLKLDIQGNEPLALAGASAMISMGKIKTVFVELNWTDQADPPAVRVISQLNQAGYVFAAPKCPLIWRRPGSWLEDCHDVIASLFPAGG